MFSSWKMAFCQYHLSHKLPVVGIPRLHCGYSIDNSIVKSQNFTYAKLISQGQNFSQPCKVARPLAKYTAGICSKIYLQHISGKEKPLNHI